MRDAAASFAADAVWRASGQLGCANVVPGAVEVAGERGPVAAQALRDCDVGFEGADGEGRQVGASAVDAADVPPVRPDRVHQPAVLVLQHEGQALPEDREEAGHGRRVGGVAEVGVGREDEPEVVPVVAAGRIGAAAERAGALVLGARSCAGCGAGILLILSVVRIVFFMQINTNRILRELKRLELQVVQCRLNALLAGLWPEL